MSWAEHKRRAARPGVYSYRIVDWVLVLIVASAVGAFLWALLAVWPH